MQQVLDQVAALPGPPKPYVNPYAGHRALSEQEQELLGEYARLADTIRRVSVLAVRPLFVSQSLTLWVLIGCSAIDASIIVVSACQSVDAAARARAQDGPRTYTVQGVGLGRRARTGRDCRSRSHGRGRRRTRLRHVWQCDQ